MEALVLEFLQNGRVPRLFVRRQEAIVPLHQQLRKGQEVGFVKIADLAYCQDGVSPRHAGSAP